MNKSARRTGWVHFRNGDRYNTKHQILAVRRPGTGWSVFSAEMLKARHPGIITGRWRPNCMIWVMWRGEEIVGWGAYV